MQIDDNSLIIILSKLNLNERFRLKLVSRKFNDLINTTLYKIKQLVIFNRTPMITGQFKFNNEEYEEEDCIHVNNLDSFFASNSKNLTNLERLVIISQNKDACELNFELNNLKHLELYNLIILNSSKLLESPTLDHFVGDQIEFKNCKLKFKSNKLANLKNFIKAFRRCLSNCKRARLFRNTRENCSS